MSPLQIISFCPAAAPFASALAGLCESKGIIAAAEQAMLLAQVAHESGGFRLMREIWGPTPQQVGYDRRADLGNTRPEALAFAAAAGVPVGRFYAGHGAIQVTGYDNHLAYSRWAHGDDRCARDPQMLTQPDDAMLSAVWFWVTRGCDRLAAPGDDAAFQAVTRRVNGGLNGLADRRVWWGKAKATLGVQP